MNWERCIKGGVPTFRNLSLARIRDTVRTQLVGEHEDDDTSAAYSGELNSAGLNGVGS